MAQRNPITTSIATFLIFSFLSSSLYIPTAHADQLALPAMPIPGTMVHLSPDFTPPNLKGITIHPDNALMFDFIIQKGDKSLSDAQKQEEYKKLVKYFLASLTIPDDNQWVNLSPYEKNRIIKDDFGKTEMGRDLLAQDYILKQLTASLIYPEDNLGKKFWDKVYAKAQQQYGTTNVPVNTFNKVWIVPNDALVYEKGNTAYVIKNHLKVMLEEDYLALSKHEGLTTAPSPDAQTNKIGSQVVRDIVLPALEKEVNEGANFAPLRQVFSGMILAAWYKRALKESLLGKIYANQAKVQGVNQNPQNNQAIYQEYLKAYKKGVFNYIKEDTDRLTNESIPRKYFSGGVIHGYPNGVPVTKIDAEGAPGARAILNASDSAQVVLGENTARQADAAMTSIVSTQELPTTIQQGLVDAYLLPIAEEGMSFDVLVSLLISSVPADQIVAKLERHDYVGFSPDFVEATQQLSPISILGIRNLKRMHDKVDPAAQKRLIEYVKHAQVVVKNAQKPRMAVADRAMATVVSSQPVFTNILKSRIDNLLIGIAIAYRNYSLSPLKPLLSLSSGQEAMERIIHGNYSGFPEDLITYLKGVDKNSKDAAPTYIRELVDVIKRIEDPAAQGLLINYITKAEYEPTYTLREIRSEAYPKPIWIDGDVQMKIDEVLITLSQLGIAPDSLKPILLGLDVFPYVFDSDRRKEEENFDQRLEKGEFKGIEEPLKAALIGNEDLRRQLRSLVKLYVEGASFEKRYQAADLLDYIRNAQVTDAAMIVSTYPVLSSSVKEKIDDLLIRINREIKVPVSSLEPLLHSSNGDEAINRLKKRDNDGFSPVLIAAMQQVHSQHIVYNYIRDLVNIVHSETQDAQNLLFSYISQARIDSGHGESIIITNAEPQNIWVNERDERKAIALLVTLGENRIPISYLEPILRDVDSFSFTEDAKYGEKRRTFFDNLEKGEFPGIEDSFKITLTTNNAVKAAVKDLVLLLSGQLSFGRGQFLRGRNEALALLSFIRHAQVTDQSNKAPIVDAAMTSVRKRLAVAVTAALALAPVDKVQSQVVEIRPSQTAQAQKTDRGITFTDGFKIEIGHKFDFKSGPASFPIPATVVRIQKTSNDPTSAAYLIVLQGPISKNGGDLYLPVDLNKPQDARKSLKEPNQNGPRIMGTNDRFDDNIPAGSIIQASQASDTTVKFRDGFVLKLGEIYSYDFQSAFGGVIKTRVKVTLLKKGTDNFGNPQYDITLEDVSKGVNKGQKHIITVVPGLQDHPQDLTNSQAQGVTPGGIDMNSANLNLQVKRDGQGVPLPIGEQDLENIKIDGFIPVIIKITPAMTTPLLSELEKPNTQELAKT